MSPQNSSKARRAAVPRRAAGIGLLGMILGLALAALGCLAIYDAAVLLGWVDGTPPLTSFLSDEASLTRDIAVSLAAGLAILLGLLLLWLALKPGRRRGVRLDATTGVWMTWADVERLAAGTAESNDGVLSARAQASARRVDVSAETTTTEVEPAVRAALTERLSPLSPTPRVTLRTRPKHGG